jgi:hypothetical protein
MALASMWNGSEENTTGMFGKTPSDSSYCFGRHSSDALLCRWVCSLAVDENVEQLRHACPFCVHQPLPRCTEHILSGTRNALEGLMGPHCLTFLE